MSADGQTRELEGGSNVHAEAVSTPKTKNRYNKMEWAGAFGDIGTLIPFVVAYITRIGLQVVVSYFGSVFSGIAGSQCDFAEQEGIMDVHDLNPRQIVCLPSG